jgi:mono/diheme cytochrome c family protein
MPVVGDLTVTLMRGGTDMGQLTISRFFTLHVMILPLTLVALVLAHLIALRTSGAAGPWEERKREVSGPFWPYQAFKDTMTASGVIISLIALSVFLPPPFTGAADPLSSTFTPKPEWNFLFLYQALKYFKGPLEPLGVAGVPAILVLLLVALPFIDRNPERNPLKRPLALSIFGILAATLIILTIAGYVSKPASTEQTISESSAEAPAAPPSPQTGLPGAENTATGANIYQSNGCAGCHKINGTGGIIGPDLSEEGNLGRSRDWLTIQIRTPKAHFPDTIMPSFSKLAAADMSALVDYLISLKASSQQASATAEVPITAKAVNAVTAPASSSEPAPAVQIMPAGRAAGIIGNAEQGEMLFDKQCVSCHANAGKGGVANPGSDDKLVPALNPIDKALFSKNAREFALSIDKFIQHGSKPDGAAPQLVMPAFGDNNSLTQQQISNIEAYILKLNGIDRTGLVNPGISPVSFFFIAVPAFLLVMLVIGGIYRCLPDNDKIENGEKKDTR